jgi:hypothetical protein
MAQPTFDFDLAGVCEKVLKQAEDYAKGNYPMNLEKKKGTLDFLLDPSNGSVKTELSQDSHRIVRGKVLYKQPTKSCEILTGDDAKDTGICDEAVESEEKSVDVVIDDAIATKPRKFTAEKFHTICQDPSAFMKEYLDSDLRAAREKLNERALAKIAVDAGRKYRHNGSTVLGGTYTDVQLLASSGGQSLPLIGNYQEFLLQDYTNMKFTGTPALIGQGNLQTFLSLAKMSCCNSSGISYESAIADAGAAVYLDQSANSVLGAADRFIMAAFGASHLLWFNKNRLGGKPNNDLVRHIVIPDPVYPRLSWDLDFKWDECNEVWTYQFSASFDVFNVFQADSFSTDSGASSPSCYDELFGVTGIWGYRATKA